MEMVYESELKQIATVEIQYPEDVARLVVVHGPQEAACQDEKEDFYTDLHAEVERCISGGKRLILAGDFNARLDPDPENAKEITGNGKRLNELVEKYDLKVLNFQPGAEGKWTRIQRKDGELCKSQIDYIITDPATQKRSRNTMIDEDKMFTPYRTRKVGKEKELVFSDHCTITTCINMAKGCNLKKIKREKTKYWVLTDDGISRYQKVTSNDMGLGEMSKYSEPYDMWKKKTEEMMHLCFTKKTVKQGKNLDIPQRRKAVQGRSKLHNIPANYP